MGRGEECLCEKFSEVNLEIIMGSVPPSARPVPPPVIGETIELVAELPKSSTQKNKEAVATKLLPNGCATTSSRIWCWN
ncbi:hypothetical protein LIMNO130_50002 [Limnobacter sp. 130]|nr:hypothetical protein LIMNO130_50002 [Limnobacter sp. 130]